jgi:methenyltetrahydromethanopterin cyclohydrolase
LLSINREAMKIVHKILEAPEAIGVKVLKTSGGTTVIDMGQEAPGGWLAGKYYTLITLGGLGEVIYENFLLGDFELTAVRVMLDNPLEACFASQIAGWRIEERPDAPIGAGPARALHRNPDKYFRIFPYQDFHHEGVLAIQTNDPATDDLALSIAEICGLKPENLYILVAPSTSLVCAIQVSARIVEQTLHRLEEEGFDVWTIVHAHGYCIIPPLSDNEMVAFGRINDALLYGGVATLAVRSTDEEVERIIPRVTSTASPTYGRLFGDIYEEAGRDFFNTPLELNSPAVVQINNLTTGRIFRAGRIDHEILKHSFYNI